MKLSLIFSVAVSPRFKAGGICSCWIYNTFISLKVMGKCSFSMHSMFMFVFLAAMGPMVLEVVEEVVLTRATVSLLGRVTASRATEATTRALTAAPAPTAREDTAAMVSPRQVDEDSITVQNLTVSPSVTRCCVVNFDYMCYLSGGYSSPSSNQGGGGGGGGGYSHSGQSYGSGGYNNNSQPSNMSYNQQSSFSGYSQQQPPPSSSSG